MAYRCAILDDYQNVALKLADWGRIAGDVEIKAFNDAVRRSDEDTIRELKDFDIVVMMRERTRFPRPVIDGLPKLKLLITTGAYNASIDMAACKERGIVVCGTTSFGNPTTGITFGLILELTRRIGWENARMKAGVPWQVTLGMDIEGKTLGVLGLGKLGARAAGVGKAFGMKVVAWSQNLTPERCKEVGVEYISKEELFRNSDLVLSMAKGLCDPDKLEGVENGVMIADCNIDRKDNTGVIRYLQNKYSLDHLQTIPMEQLSGKIAVKSP